MSSKPRLGTIREEFRRTYAPLLDRLAITRAPVLVLTVYNPCFDGHGVDAIYMPLPGLGGQSTLHPRAEHAARCAVVTIQAQVMNAWVEERHACGRLSWSSPLHTTL